MYEDYDKEIILHDKSEDEKKAEIIISLIKAKKELNLATRNFETAENGLIDYYTYQIKASKSKLDFLVSKARDKGLSLNMIEEIYFKNNQVG